MDTKQVIFVVLFYITVVGALNWGLQVAGYNLVEKMDLLPVIALKRLKIQSMSL